MDQEIKSLNDQLKGEVSSDCSVYILKVPSNIGKASILASSTNFGLSFLLIEGVFKEDLHLHFSFSNPNPILFNYCREGHCFHTLANEQIHYLIPNMATTITCNPFEDQEIRISGNIPCTLVIMFLDKEKYRNDILCGVSINEDLFDSLFECVGRGQPFFYQGYYSISISEYIQEIESSKHKGLVNKTFLDSRMMLLLSMNLEQYQSDLTSSSKQVLLRKYDLKKIIEARKILIANYQNPPTIIELSRKVGINQQKLKKGFKLVFDTTINKYLTNYRMEQAMLLLIDGHSVKEVAELIGYSNHSHFSRKFKEKYGVLPKDYRKNISFRISTNNPKVKIRKREQNLV